MASLYAQLPLDHPDKQIRLLQIEAPLSDSNDHNFSMEAHDLHDDVRPSYIAISYTWGALIPILPITINGCEMQVQFNCWYALWQMRYHDHTKNEKLWIDSLCINQNDNEEKQFQVAMMGTIYSFAMWVASSLGTGDSIGTLGPTLASGRRNAIGRLRDRFDQMPYFDRVWIKQEIALARNVTLFGGLEAMSWLDFDRVINTVSASPYDPMANDTTGSDSDTTSVGSSTTVSDDDHHHHHHDDDYDYDHDDDDDNLDLDSDCLDSGEKRSRDTKFNTKFKARIAPHSTTIQLCNHRAKTRQVWTFVDLVITYQKAKATNPLDKIYALLSLLPEEDPVRQNIPVVYGSGAALNLFHNLVKLIYCTYRDVKAEKKHRALCMIQKWIMKGCDKNIMSYMRSHVPSPPKPGNGERIRIGVGHVEQICEEDDIEFRDQLAIERKLSTPREMFKWVKSSFGCSDNDMRGVESLTLPFELERMKVLCIYKREVERAGPVKEVEKLKLFMVNTDVQAGDCLGEVALDWDESGKGASAHAIFRKVTTTAEENGGNGLLTPSDGTKPGKTAFVLHSWAVPVRRAPRMLSLRNGRFTFGRNQSMGRMELHYNDALYPFLLNYDPLPSLLYSRTTDFLSWIEDTERVLKYLKVARAEALYEKKSYLEDK